MHIQYVYSICAWKGVGIVQREKMVLRSEHERKTINVRHLKNVFMTSFSSKIILTGLSLIKVTGVNWTRITCSSSPPTMPLGQSNVWCWTGQNRAFQQNWPIRLNYTLCVPDRHVRGYLGWKQQSFVCVVSQCPADKRLSRHV